MDFYFYTILGISAGMLIGFAFLTKGILFHGPATDNELLAHAASQSHKWRWPSDIHKYGIAKTATRDISIITIALFQNIFRDYESDYPYTFASAFAVTINSILIFLILRALFNPPTAFLTTLLYIISFWPWQMALSGGHSIIGTMYILAGIYVLILIPIHSEYTTVLTILAGFIFALSLFASPSTHKITPIFLATLIFTFNNSAFKSGSYLDLVYSMPFYQLWPIIITFIILWFISILAIHYSIPRIIDLIYRQRGPSRLNRIISSRDKFPLDHYIRSAYKKFNLQAKLLSGLVIIVAILISTVSIKSLLFLGLGFFTGILIFTLPDIKSNLLAYWRYVYEPQRKTHFRLYVDYYAARGITIERNTRGPGISWVPKIFSLFAPFHTFLFCMLFFVGIYFLPKISVILIAALAISPTLWAEFTRAPQVSRVYSPTLATVGLLYAYVLSNIPGISWTIYFIFFIPALVWNIFQFFNDIYPARMAVKWLAQSITNLAIKDIYTYDIPFNLAFAKNLPGVAVSEYLPPKESHAKNQYAVHYINSISEVKDGWIAIPGTSTKALNMGSQPEAIEGDFEKDILLSAILRNRSIEKIAEKKFKTYGTSLYWVHEDDILSYRSFKLNEISVHDLWRGHGWLLHSSQLKLLESDAH